MPKVTSTAARRGERGDLTRQKLLDAAIDVFGRYGFDGASTRMLTDAANVNLQSIPYYFGGKEGLYVAAAEHIVELISAHVAPVRARMLSSLGEMHASGKAIDVADARALLGELLTTMAGVFLSAESEPWARFIIREQMVPTEAFTRIYAGVMKPMLGVASQLVGRLLGADPASEQVRLRTMALLGGIMVFRVAHAAVLAQLDWKSVGPHELEQVRALARDLVAAIGDRGTSP